MKRFTVISSLLLAICLLFSACGYVETIDEQKGQDTGISVEDTEEKTDEKDGIEYGEDTEQSGAEEKPDAEEKPSEEKQNEKFVLPAYTGDAYTVINKNEPFFDEIELTESSFERYGALDELGRCTAAVASIGRDLMPTEDRGNIGMVKPTGWQTVRYDVVDGKYLYNRCHLIGFQLTGENANEKNLITGTRYMNVDGMLPFENMVADYVKETGNHVMYRVTPVFSEHELLARGVLMEAYSVEDEGEGICFCVFVHNVQPQIEINYADGSSVFSGKTDSEENTEEKKEESYVLNKNTKKFHYPSCASAKNIKENNREDYTGTREDIINRGYSPCGNCKP